MLIRGETGILTVFILALIPDCRPRHTLWDLSPSARYHYAAGSFVVICPARSLLRPSRPHVRVYNPKVRLGKLCLWGVLCGIQHRVKNANGHHCFAGTVLSVSDIITVLLAEQSPFQKVLLAEQLRNISIQVGLPMSHNLQHARVSLVSV